MINEISGEMIAQSTTLESIAYLGPGAAISTIGTLLALIAAVAVAFFGFFWYPIKRIMRKKKSQEPDAVSKEEADKSAPKAVDPAENEDTSNPAVDSN